MNNKTCGECRYYEHPAGQCMKVIEYNNCHITDKACEYFEPKVITNGDVIRQGGNRVFAEYFVFETGAMFASTLIVDKTFDTYDEAVEATETYLNAPAKEGEDE